MSRQSRKEEAEFFWYAILFIFASITAHIYWIKRLKQSQLHYKLKITLIIFQITLVSLVSYNFHPNNILPKDYGFFSFFWEMAKATGIAFIPTIVLQYIFEKINFKLISLEII